MKKRIIAVLPLAILFLAILFTACPPGGDPDVDPVLTPKIPKIIETAPTSFNLDAYQAAGRRTQALNFTDYFDVEGVSGEITYGFEVTEGNTDVVTATQSSNRVTVTARGKGAATVRLDALVDTVTKASVSVAFTVADSSPLQVTFPSSDQVTFDGAATAPPQTDYTFTVIPTLDYIVETTIKVTYKVGSGDSKEIEGVKPAESFPEIEVYRFTIPAAEVVDAIEILSVSGLTQNLSPYSAVVFTAAGDFEISGGERAYTNKDYTFTVAAPSYYTTPSVTYKVGSGAEKTINGVSKGDGLFVNYDFTVPMADLVADQELTILSVGNLSLNTVKNMPDSFWQADAWEDLAAGPADQPKPVETDGTLTFTNTIIRRQGGSSSPGFSTGTSADTWSQLSFMVQTSDVINMLFSATSNTRVNSTSNPTTWGTGDNWIRLFTNDEGTLFMSTGQSNVNPLAQASNVSYTVGEWARIDLIYRKLSDNLAEMKLFYNGVKAELEATEFSHNQTAIVNGAMNCAIAAPNYGDRTAVWAGASSVAFKKVEE